MEYQEKEITTRQESMNDVIDNTDEILRALSDEVKDIDCFLNGPKPAAEESQVITPGMINRLSEQRDKAEQILHVVVNIRKSLHP